LYKLLIVDDERDIREGLGRFDWKSLGIEVSGICDNGLSAFSHVMDDPVDIILTDIRMPIMNGLDLIEKVRKQFPFIKIVVLSGCDDFDYALSCITNGVLGYLLKPTDPDQLIETFNKITQQLNDEKQIKVRLSTLERKARFTTKAFKNSFLKDILQRSLMPDEMEEGCLYGELIFDAELYTVCVFQLDGIMEKKASITANNWKLIIFALDNIMDELWEQTDMGYRWVDPASADCCIIVTDPCLQRDMEKLKNEVHRTKENLNKVKGLFKTTISVGIGSSEQRPEDIWSSAKNARIALSSITDGDKTAVYPSQNSYMSMQSESDHENTDIECAEKLEKYRQSGRQIINAAQKYINDNYSRSITLAEVAGHVYINTTYLSTLFKELTGENFVHYITKCRVKKAQELLRDVQYNVCEIGEMVGYENPRYFSEVFKKNVGMTPYEFRNTY
jgi:two-component system response regulator YesN